MDLDAPDDDVSHTPLQVRQLAEVLRMAQRDLDAHREGAPTHTSDRQKLARKVDLLSHLLLAHRRAASADGTALAEVSEALHLSHLDLTAKPVDDGIAGAD